MTALSWYAVYTKPFWEKKVADLLTVAGIESYCPLQKSERQWSDRKKIIYTPLFRSYVFVHVNEKTIPCVKQVTGVVYFVNFLGRPAAIRDVEIDTIKKFHNEYENIEVKKADFAIHDNVRIIGGPLMNLEGNVISVGSKTVEVYLPSFGYVMSAKIEKHNLVRNMQAGGNLS